MVFLTSCVIRGGSGVFQLYAWPLLETVFSEVLTRDEWLMLWDHVVSNPPSFLLMLTAAYSVCARGPLMQCTELDDFQVRVCVCVCRGWGGGCMYACVGLYVYVCMHVCVYAYLCACVGGVMHVCVCVCVCVYVHACCECVFMCSNFVSDITLSRSHQCNCYFADAQQVVQTANCQKPGTLVAAIGGETGVGKCRVPSDCTLLLSCLLAVLLPPPQRSGRAAGDQGGVPTG